MVRLFRERNGCLISTQHLPLDGQPRKAASATTRRFDTLSARQTSTVSFEGIVMKFEELGLAETLLRAVRGEGYSTPTKIQAASIPVILEGRDILGCAQTGTGKTAAFALPTLQRLAANPGQNSGRRKIRTLVLAPTRELALQIGESFQAYGRYTGLRRAVVFGGVGQNPQVRALQAGVDILIATPGRLLDLMQQRFIDLSHV